MLSVVEHFHSIQGEGREAGQNAFFIRLAGCNLRCKGFGCTAKSPKTGEILTGCDTIRAVATSHFDYERLGFEGLISLLLPLKSKPMIVITGGEPLLSHQDMDLVRFLEYAISVGFRVWVETNGTIDVDFERFSIYKKCKFAISPKLALSSELYHKRINKSALKSLFKNAECFYKFVIKGDEIDEIRDILAIQNGEVWCMPLAKNRAELEIRAPGVVRFCIEHGFNYSDRLQIRIWDDLSGV